MRKSRRDLWNNINDLAPNEDEEETGLRQNISYDLVAEWGDFPTGGDLEWVDGTE